MIPTLAPLAQPTIAASGFAAGLALGLIHFATLRTITALYMSQTGCGRVLVLQLARFAVLCAALTALAQAGPLPLLSAAAGVLAGRFIVMRRSRGET
jgi:hypothetical protein